MDAIDLATAIPDPDALKMVPKNIARRYSMLPINFDKNEKVLTLAMADTFNIVAIDSGGGDARQWHRNIDPGCG